jgi:hypothetical protein
MPEMAETRRGGSSWNSQSEEYHANFEHLRHVLPPATDKISTFPAPIHPNVPGCRRCPRTVFSTSRHATWKALHTQRGHPFHPPSSSIPSVPCFLGPCATKDPLLQVQTGGRPRPRPLSEGKGEGGQGGAGDDVRLHSIVSPTPRHPWLGARVRAAFRCRADSRRMLPRSPVSEADWESYHACSCINMSRAATANLGGAMPLHYVSGVYWFVAEAGGAGSRQFSLSWEPGSAPISCRTLSTSYRRVFALANNPART